MKRPKRKDTVERLWDSFTVKDLTLREFRKQYETLLGTAGLQQEFTTIVLDRQMKRSLDFVARNRKKEIDRSMK